jgi:ribonuclease D
MVCVVGELVSLPVATLITTPKELQDLVRSLLSVAVAVAVDTESNNQYAYQSKVCLIQLSTYSQDYIIDPISIGDMSELGKLMSATSIEKVFHGCEYDVVSLKRDFHYTFTNIFDTMYASRFVDGVMPSLADLLLQHFDVSLDKSHQMDNWGMRPLAEESLQYAQMDTHYLLPLRDKYYQKLDKMGCIDEIRDIFADIALLDPKDSAYDPDGFWKLVRPHQLSKRQMAVLQSLYQTREELAQEEDVPPSRVMENRTLVELAESLPTNRRELNTVRSLRPEIIRIYGDDILDAIERGHKNKPPKNHPIAHNDPIISDRYVVLHQWRKEKAIQRSIESNMVMTKDVLWRIARIKPTSIEELMSVEGMGKWRIAHYGEEILNVVAAFRK